MRHMEIACLRIKETERTERGAHTSSMIIDRGAKMKFPESEAAAETERRESPVA